MKDLRRKAVELAYWLADHGQPATGPVSLAVTEGREASQYAHGWGSSCVELVDCVAFAMGCRDAAINRDEHTGRQPQRDLGWYLSGSRHTGTRIIKPREDEIEPGDFLGYDFWPAEEVHSRGAHACVFLCWLPDGRARTADYGQPGGKVRDCRVTKIGDRLLFRGRWVDGLVKLATLECPEPSLCVSEWQAAHGLPVEPWIPYELVDQIMDDT